VWESQRVSVVLPAYNEADNIARAVQEFRAVPAVDEVIVIDNNSRDDSGRLAEEAGARVVRETRQGYGFALRRGLAEATGEIIVLAEPDGTFVAHDILKLLSYTGEFDMVLGTRTTRELIWSQANMGWFLRVGNVVVAKLVQVLFGGPSLSDCGCTFRLIHRQALEKIRGRLTVGGSHFLPEMVVLALESGLRIIEIPVNYRSRSFKEGKKVSITRDPLTWFRALARLRLSRIDPLGTIEDQRARQIADPNAWPSHEGSR